MPIDPDRMLTFPAEKKLHSELESVEAFRGLPEDVKQVIINEISKHFAKTEQPMRDVSQWVWSIISVAVGNFAREGENIKADISDDIMALFQKYGPKGTRPD